MMATKQQLGEIRVATSVGSKKHFEVAGDGSFLVFGDKAQPPVQLEFKPTDPTRTCVLLPVDEQTSEAASPDSDGYYRVPVGFKKGPKSWYVHGSGRPNHFAVITMDDNGFFTRTMVFIVVQKNKAHVCQAEQLEAQALDSKTVEDGKLPIVPTSAFPLYEGEPAFHARWVNTAREAVQLARLMNITLPPASDHPMPVLDALEKIPGNQAIITWWYAAGPYGGCVTGKGVNLFVHINAVKDDGFILFAPGDRVSIGGHMERDDGGLAATGVRRLS